MAFDRSANSRNRVRRMFQRMGTGSAFGFGDGLAFDDDTSTITIDLATASGLEFVSNALRINLDTNPGLMLGADGLAIDLDGSSLALGVGGLSVAAPDGVRTVTAIQAANYNAAAGETVRYDPSGGTFTITLPTAAGIAGRRVVTKNVTNDLTAITVAAAGAETIDGAASVGPSLAFEARTFESDGANWMEL